MNYSQLFTTALSIVSIATLAGLGLLRGTVTNLRESLSDARKEIDDKDRRLTDLEKNLALKSADLDALGRVVTGEAHLTALQQQVEEHHEIMIRSVADIKAEIVDVIKKLAQHP